MDNKNRCWAVTVCMLKCGTQICLSVLITQATKPTTKEIKRELATIVSNIDSKPMYIVKIEEWSGKGLMGVEYKEVF